MLIKITLLSFIITGLTWFTLGAYNKLKFKDLFCQYAPNNYYFKLFECDFCLSIRISLFYVIIYSLFNTFEINILIIPVIVSGFTYKINL